jgi:hypothetical protein
VVANHTFLISQGATVRHEPPISRSGTHAAPDVGNAPSPTACEPDPYGVHIHAERQDRQPAKPSPHPTDLLLQYILAVQDALVGYPLSVTNTHKHKRHSHTRNQPSIVGPLTIPKREPNPTAQWAQNVRYVLTTPAFVPQSIDLLPSTNFLPYFINLPTDLASPSFTSILGKATANPAFATTFSGFLCLSKDADALLPEGVVRGQFRVFCDSAATRDWSKGILGKRWMEVEDFAPSR